jgi:hypothetical protein
MKYFLDWLFFMCPPGKLKWFILSLMSKARQERHYEIIKQSTAKRLEKLISDSARMNQEHDSQMKSIKIMKMINKFGNYFSPSKN